MAFSESSVSDAKMRRQMVLELDCSSKLAAGSACSGSLHFVFLTYSAGSRGGRAPCLTRTPLAKEPKRLVDLAKPAIVDQQT